MGSMHFHNLGSHFHFKPIYKRKYLLFRMLIVCQTCVNFWQRFWYNHMRTSIIKIYILWLRYIWYIWYIYGIWYNCTKSMKCQVKLIRTLELRKAWSLGRMAWQVSKRGNENYSFFFIWRYLQIMRMIE